MRNRRHKDIALAALAALATELGCISPGERSAYTTVPQRDGKSHALARDLNEKGLAAVERKKFEAAEQLFREALSHDLYYAPAHNNLGLVLLEQQAYYEAAWEFDYAARLAPRSPEPRQNLALLYEKLGRLDQAIEGYEAALEMTPQDAVVMRHLARAYVKAGRKEKRLKDVLEKLLLIPGDRQWDVWARGQLIRLGRPEQDEPPTPLGDP